MLLPVCRPRCDPVCRLEQEGERTVCETAKCVHCLLPCGVCQKLREEVKQGERIRLRKRFLLCPFHAHAQPERAQVGARLRDCHRELVGADVAVFLSLEEEHTAFFEIGGEQVEPTDQQRDRRLVVRRHQLLAECTQERPLCREDRLQFLRELTAEHEPEKPLSDRVLLPQDTPCT